MENIIVKMDIRGFLRFPEQVIKLMKLDKMAKQDSSKKGEIVEIYSYGRHSRGLWFGASRCR